MSHMEFIHLLGIIPGHLCPAWNRNVMWVLNRRAMRKAPGEVAVLVRFLARPTMFFDFTIPPCKWDTLSLMFYWHCYFLHS